MHVWVCSGKGGAGKSHGVQTLISNLLTSSSCGWSSSVTSGCLMFCFEVIIEQVLVSKCSVLLLCMWVHLKSRCLLLKTSQKIPDIGGTLQDWLFLFSSKDFVLAGVGCLDKAGESFWTVCKLRSLCSTVIKLFLLTVTREIESVNHKHEQCCYVPGTARPTWTLGLGTEGLFSR